MLIKVMVTKVMIWAVKLLNTTVLGVPTSLSLLLCLQAPFRCKVVTVQQECILECKFKLDQVSVQVNLDQLSVILILQDKLTQSYSPLTTPSSAGQYSRSNCLALNSQPSRSSVVKTLQCCIARRVSAFQTDLYQAGVSALGVNIPDIVCSQARDAWCASRLLLSSMPLIICRCWEMLLW